MICYAVNRFLDIACLTFLCVQNTILSLWRWTRFRGQDQNDLETTGNAFFTNADAGKAFAGVFNSAAVMGAPDASANRPAFLFQVSSSGTLDATNIFFSGGILSDIDALFTAGRFNLRATAGFDGTFAGNQPVP